MLMGQDGPSFGRSGDNGLPERFYLTFPWVCGILRTWNKIALIRSVRELNNQ